MIPMFKLSGRLGNQMFRHAYIYTQMKDGIIPDVYVQDPKYFEKYENEIKSLFSQEIGYIPEIGIHFRKGDYVNNPFYVDLSKTDYYQKAIAEFPYNRRFLVISDDIVKAKEFFTNDRFPDKEFLFSDGNDEVTDLNLFASCIGQIIANSSFSWWGAYLSPNHGKIVAPSPKIWYTDGQERTICPKTWIRI